MPKLERSSTQFLEKHGGRWRVTIAVPKALHGVLGTRLKRPLHTDSLTEANRRKWAVIAELRALIEATRAGSDGDAIAYAKSLANDLKRAVSPTERERIDELIAHEAEKIGGAPVSITLHYDGDPLLGLEKAGVPDDYQELLKQMDHDYRVLDSRGKSYQGTPTFVSLDGGLIAMRDRENGTFLEDERGGLIVFNVQHLRDLSNARTKLREQEAVSAANGAYQEFREGMLQWERDVQDAREGKYLPRKAAEIADSFTAAPAEAKETYLDLTAGAVAGAARFIGGAARSYEEGIKKGREKGKEQDKKVRAIVERRMEPITKQPVLVELFSRVFGRSKD